MVVKYAALWFLIAVLVAVIVFAMFPNQTEWWGYYWNRALGPRLV